MILLGQINPISLIASLNFCLSSASSIASGLAPIICTLYFANTPELNNSIETFKAVCPPIVGSKASGFSIFIISSTKFLVIGSM